MIRNSAHRDPFLASRIATCQRHFEFLCMQASHHRKTIHRNPESKKQNASGTSALIAKYCSIIGVIFLDINGSTPHVSVVIFSLYHNLVLFFANVRTDFPIFSHIIPRWPQAECQRPLYQRLDGLDVRLNGSSAHNSSHSEATVPRNYSLSPA